MFDSIRPLDRAQSLEAVVVPMEDVSHFKPVEGDTYGDKEAVYLDSIGPGTYVSGKAEWPASDPGGVGGITGLVRSEVRFLQSLIQRDTAMAMGTSEANGRQLQRRALFIAASLAERDK